MLGTVVILKNGQRVVTVNADAAHEAMNRAGFKFDPDSETFKRDSDGLSITDVAVMEIFKMAVDPPPLIGTTPLELFPDLLNVAIGKAG